MKWSPELLRDGFGEEKYFHLLVAELNSCPQGTTFIMYECMSTIIIASRAKLFTLMNGHPCDSAI